MTKNAPRNASAQQRRMLHRRCRRVENAGFLGGWCHPADKCELGSLSLPLLVACTFIIVIVTMNQSSSTTQFHDCFSDEDDLLTPVKPHKNRMSTVQSPPVATCDRQQHGGQNNMVPSTSCPSHLSTLSSSQLLRRARLMQTKEAKDEQLENNALRDEVSSLSSKVADLNAELLTLRSQSSNSSDAKFTQDDLDMAIADTKTSVGKNYEQGLQVCMERLLAYEQRAESLVEMIDQYKDENTKLKAEIVQFKSTSSIGSSSSSAHAHSRPLTTDAAIVKVRSEYEAIINNHRNRISELDNLCVCKVSMSRMTRVTRTFACLRPFPVKRMSLQTSGTPSSPLTNLGQ